MLRTSIAKKTAIVVHRVREGREARQEVVALHRNGRDFAHLFANRFGGWVVTAGCLTIPIEREGPARTVTTFGEAVSRRSYLPLLHRDGRTTVAIADDLATARRRFAALLMDLRRAALLRTPPGFRDPLLLIAYRHLEAGDLGL